MHGGIRIIEATVVIAQQVAALALRQKPGKCLPCLGKDLAHPLNEPLELALPREEDPPQDESETALRMRLRVGERKCRTPRSTEQQPAFHMQMRSQTLEIGDQMLR